MHTKTKKTEKPLPERWQMALDIFLQPGPPFQTQASALLAAGFSRGTAYHHAHRVFRDPRVEAIIDARWREQL